MDVTVVGSGTAAPEPGRVGSGYWIQGTRSTLLLDCGPGVLYRLARLELPWPDLDHLVISHFHTDHIGDLPALLFALKWGVRAQRTAPLTIWAPHGVQDRLRAMRAAFGDHVEDPGFPVLVREVRPGDRFDAGGVAITAHDTPHTETSLAFRVEEGGASVGYTGDTGPSAALGPFFQGCAVLIAECSLPDDEAMATHLTPRSLADLAQRAAPGLLVVTHVYPQLDDQDPCSLVQQAGWTGPTLRATDGLELVVPGTA